MNKNRVKFKKIEKTLGVGGLAYCPAPIRLSSGPFPAQKGCRKDCRRAQVSGFFRRFFETCFVLTWFALRKTHVARTSAALRFNSSLSSFLQQCGVRVCCRPIRDGRASSSKVAFIRALHVFCTLAVSVVCARPFKTESLHYCISAHAVATYTKCFSM